MGLTRSRMAACHPQRVSLRCDQFLPDSPGRTGRRYLGSWILEVEKEVGEVPGKVLRLESPLRISRPGSNIEGKDPDFRKMEGGDK